MTSRISITENELLAELAAMGPAPAPPEAMTAAEMCDALGLGSTVVKKRLAQLKADGRLEVWAVVREDSSGRHQRIPAYTIKPASKRKR